MEKIAPLFAGWEESLIWSCLEGCMGEAWADNENHPVSARILLADFCFFAGKPNQQLVAEEIRNLAEESAGNAQETEGIVKDLTGNIAVSVDNMQVVSKNVEEQLSRLKDTQEAFSLLYQEIRLVEDVSKEIGSQTGVLASLKQLVADSVNNLASIVEENAASTEETSASMQLVAEGIEECSRDTQDLVELSERQNEETMKFKL